MKKFIWFLMFVLSSCKSTNHILEVPQVSAIVSLDKTKNIVSNTIKKLENDELNCNDKVIICNDNIKLLDTELNNLHNNIDEWYKISDRCSQELIITKTQSDTYFYFFVISILGNILLLWLKK